MKTALIVIDMQNDYLSESERRSLLTTPKS